MITDEQVKLSLSAYFNEVPEDLIPSHRVVAMRNALEAYEQSKWVKLDVNDKSTHPPYEQDVLVKCRYSAEIKAEMLFISGYGVKYWREGGEYMDLYTHWQPFPEFKE